MVRLTQISRLLRQDRRGVTMLEYGLLAALVAVAAVTALTTLGTNITGVFTSVSSHLTAATPTS